MDAVQPSRAPDDQPLVRGHTRAPQHREWQAKVTWDDAVRIRDYAGLPFVLKGIMSEDAALAVRYGVDAVWVSNHGGRQLDHGEGTLDVLPESIDAVGDAAEVKRWIAVLAGHDGRCLQEACYLVRQMPCSGRWFWSGGAKVWRQRAGWQQASRVSVLVHKGMMTLVTSLGFVIGVVVDPMAPQCHPSVEELRP